MTKIILILSLVFLSGCATKYVTDLGSNKYLAVANDGGWGSSHERSTQKANFLAYEKCAGKSVVVDNVVTSRDNNGLPETSMTFHCK